MRRQIPPENRSAVFITVAWMVSTMATLFAEIASLLVQAWITLSQTPVGEKEANSDTVSLLSILLLIAVTSGLSSLLLVPLVYWLRRTPPPRLVTICSCLIAVTPLLAILLLRTITM